MEFQPEISLHAFSGWTSYKTMRVLEKIGPYEVVVLIDNGSTHNFISERVANMLQLLVVPTESFNVKVVNEGPLKCPYYTPRYSFYPHSICLTINWVGFGLRSPLAGTIRHRGM
jgi:hypothetical protein